MRTEIRPDHPGVIARLLHEPHRYDFFQAVRLLRRHFGGDGVDTPVGEQIRFRNSLALGFPASDIEAFKVSAPADTAEDQVSNAFQRVEITPSFIGLTGNHGTLPRFYTEALLEREHTHRDLAARRFLDLFGNRATALFYAAWEKYRLHIQAEHAGQNRFLPIMLALVGIASPSTRERLADAEQPAGSIYDESLAYYAGLLRMAQHSASSAEQVVQDFFAVPAQLTQFIGQWFAVPESEGTRLGIGAATLGRDALCGDRVWQRNARMRLEIGPLRRDKFEQFLPGGPAALALDKLLSMITGPTLEYEVRLVLHRDDVQPMAFDASRAQHGRLGWDCWLHSQPSEQDSTDVVYELSPGLPCSARHH